MNSSTNFSPIGHRKRLKDRFDQTGLDGFSDHEVLELFLFYVIPRKDTKIPAKALLAEFKSLEGVFAAKLEQLQAIPGMGGESGRFIHLFREMSRLILRRKVLQGNSNISSISDLLTYLGGSMANLPEEQFRVVYVDHGNRVVKDEVLSNGTEDQTAVFPKQIMKRALGLNSTGILVVHNHPSGVLQPSKADRDITRALYAAAAALDIRLLDHLIIGREGKGYYSFRENRLLP